MSTAQPERRNADFPVVAPTRRIEPEAPRPQGESRPVRPAPPADKILFEPDAPAAPAKAVFSAQTLALLNRLADLLGRPDAPTPIAVGLLAPAGGGKSSALNWLAERLGAAGAPVATLRASDLGDEPERALAAALYRALSPRHGTLVREAAQEAAHFGADPGALARAAQDQLDGLRRKLILEKQALAQSETRRAALKETLLYETPGTRVDVYARKMRNAFEPRLRRFGFTGEALAAFKDLVRDLNESGGLVRRLLTSLRGVYAFKGQKSLLVFSALFFAANQGFAWLAANKPMVLGLMTSGGDMGAQSAAFLQNRLDWLPMAAQVCALIALALLGLNLWRAFDFMHPLLHAAGLLDQDVADRRHEIEQTLAHQARNVDLMGGEVDALARKAAEAERRANAAGASRNPPLFLETDLAAQKRDHALGFMESLSDLMMRGNIAGAPHRVAVAIDGLESVAAPAATFRRLNDLVARPGFLAIHALDPALMRGEPDELARRIQLPLRLDVMGATEPASLAPLDAPLSAQEIRLTEALAPLTGGNPRAQKRLRNLFRFLRPAPGAPAGFAAALALFIAAEIGASTADAQALERALAEPSGPFAPQGSRALQEALASLAALDGPISLVEARRAATLARQISLHAET
ncbi:MAG TPA: hypothetical protein VMU18_09095 [Rhodoblastus sp.]|nr:hypothetical protein [Rhodoblastus sp.]